MRKTRRTERRPSRLLLPQVRQTRVVGEYRSCGSTSQTTDEASVSALAGAWGCSWPIGTSTSAPATFPTYPELNSPAVEAGVGRV